MFQRSRVLAVTPQALDPAIEPSPRTHCRSRSSHRRWPSGSRATARRRPHQVTGNRPASSMAGRPQSRRGPSLRRRPTIVTPAPEAGGTDRPARVVVATPLSPAIFCATTEDAPVSGSSPVAGGILAFRRAGANLSTLEVRRVWSVDGSERPRESDPEMAGLMRGTAQHQANKSLFFMQLCAAGGGGTGIRTQETFSRLTVFKTAAFNHSAIPPRGRTARFILPRPRAPRRHGVVSSRPEARGGPAFAPSPAAPARQGVTAWRVGDAATAQAPGGA